MSAVEAAAVASSLPWERMVSGAFHDALNVARRNPTGMIFVPSRAGVSHHPAEHTDDVHLIAGAEVLASTLLDLARR